MVNKDFLKFSLGFMVVIAFSFVILIVIGYYKIENTAINTTSNNKEFEAASR